jgi:aconitate hydratase
VFKGDANWQQDQDARRQDLRLGRQVDLREEPALLRRHDDDAGADRRRQGRARARVLGDSVTTDHISPAGNIKKNSPAART